MQLLEAVQRAKATLEAGLSAPVRLRGEPQPEDGPLCLLDILTSQPNDVQRSLRNTVQVGVYTDTVGETLLLNEQVIALMEAAGFHMGQTRPAPDDSAGLITDWRIG